MMDDGNSTPEDLTQEVTCNYARNLDPLFKAP